jgi:hypothetical protein
VIFYYADCIIGYVGKNADAFAFFGGVVGGALALREFLLRRITDRKKLAAESYEKFKSAADTQLATKMLDWTGEFVLGKDKRGRKLTQYIHDDFLADTLDTSTTRPYTEAQRCIRDIFDNFLTELEMLAALQVSKLLQPKDLDPFLYYWVEIMANQRNQNKRPKTIAQLRKFIGEFGYDNVEILIQRCERQKTRQ